MSWLKTCLSTVFACPKFHFLSFRKDMIKAGFQNHLSCFIHEMFYSEALILLTIKLHNTVEGALDLGIRKCRLQLQLCHLIFINFLSFSFFSGVNGSSPISQASLYGTNEIMSVQVVYKLKRTIQNIISIIHTFNNSLRVSLCIQHCSKHEKKIQKWRFALLLLSWQLFSL